MQKSEASKQKDKERNSAWFAAHPNYKKEWSAANKDRVLEYSRRHGAKRRGKRGAYYKAVWAENKDAEKARWRSRYGLTQDGYEALLAEQNGQCGICATPFNKPPCVDHCHETGKIRGLLCRKCNMALGSLGDSVAGLQRAIRYLQGG